MRRRRADMVRSGLRQLLSRPRHRMRTYWSRWNNIRRRVAVGDHLGAKTSPVVFGMKASFSSSLWCACPLLVTADEMVLVKALRFHVPDAAPFLRGVLVTMASGRRNWFKPVDSVQPIDRRASEPRCRCQRSVTAPARIETRRQPRARDAGHCCSLWQARRESMIRTPQNGSQPPSPQMRTLSGHGPTLLDLRRPCAKSLHSSLIRDTGRDLKHCKVCCAECTRQQGSDGQTVVLRRASLAS